jgi:Uma2 family endonuclease
LAEYLAIEPEGKVRHEFIDGELVAMTGTSRAHNLITMNLGAAIRPHLRGTPCRVVSTDMKVVIATAQRGYYPDLIVSCSDPADELDEYTETQPQLIIEVLSPSIEAFDRTEKWRPYQPLSSLQDDVRVAQSAPQVEVYSRQAAGWQQTPYGPGATVELPSIDLELPMVVIYCQRRFRTQQNRPV